MMTFILYAILAFLVGFLPLPFLVFLEDWVDDSAND